MNDDLYQAYIRAALNVAIGIDVQDRVDTDPTWPADRTPHADELRRQHRAADLTAFRAASDAWSASLKH